MHKAYSNIAVLAEDKLSTELLLSIFSQHAGSHVTEYNSGQSLINDIADGSFTPQLIITELTSSDIDYFCFVRELNQFAMSCDFLLISGMDRRLMGTANLMARNFGYDVIGTIAKPISADDVHWTLRSRKQRRLQKKSRKINVLSQGDISSGLRNHALRVVYQPKWCTTSNVISGFEALARWSTSDGLLSPAAFIPVAEKVGLITPITWQLTELVLNDAQSLFDQYGDIRLAINFCISTLQDVSVPDKLLLLCEKYAVSPHNITIEVTESRISEDGLALLEVLSRLHLSGFKISVDDFGTGYSSLYRIKTLPFSELKIDKSFIAGVSDTTSSQAVVSSSITLARELALKVVAEGVEKPEQETYLKNIGCDEIQGFYRGYPEPVQHWLKSDAVLTEMHG